MKKRLNRKCKPGITMEGRSYPITPEVIKHVYDIKEEYSLLGIKWKRRILKIPIGITRGSRFTPDTNSRYFYKEEILHRVRKKGSVLFEI